MPQIQPVDIVAPGAFGLNTEKKNTLLRPQWCTTALNAVIHRSGRIGSRYGWADQTTTGITGDHQIEVLHEYLNEDGTSTILSTANNVIYKNITDFTVGANAITSTTAPTANAWQFVNFNGKVLGFQRGHTPIEWSGASVFTDASYTGTGPDGNCAVAAFGRVWAADADKQTVRVSALLDDTDYSTGSGGGTIDMSSLWTQGMDEIVAISAIGANLVVFGRNHIVLWADGSGSEIGMTLAGAQVVDTIEGTGCIARDSVQATGEGDLIFLSRHGLQSLGRVIKFKSNPVVTITKNVRTDFVGELNTERAADPDLDDMRSVWHAEEGLYVLNFPQCGCQWVLDTEHPFEDDEGDTVFPITRWSLGGTPRGLLSTKAGDMYIGGLGIVGRYEGAQDDGVAYDFEFKTGWLDFGELNHRLKMMKEIVATVQTGEQSIVWNWEFDFSGNTLTRTAAYTGSNSSEFGVAEFNIDEFSGTVALQRKNLPAHGEGQFLRLGCLASVNGFDVTVQQMSISPKIGRAIT